MDINFKKSWFGDYSIKNSKKIYFYRARFANTKKGMEGALKIKKRVIYNINLCFKAWTLIVNSLPYEIAAEMVPLITYKDVEAKDGIIEKHPMWIFVNNEKTEE